MLHYRRERGRPGGRGTEGYLHTQAAVIFDWQKSLRIFANAIVGLVATKFDRWKF